MSQPSMPASPQRRLEKLGRGQAFGRSFPAARKLGPTDWRPHTHLHPTFFFFCRPPPPPPPFRYFLDKRTNATLTTDHYPTARSFQPVCVLRMYVCVIQGGHMRIHPIWILCAPLSLLSPRSSPPAREFIPDRRCLVCLPLRRQDLQTSLTDGWVSDMSGYARRTASSQSIAHHPSPNLP
jgi:hypothetical protein